MLEKDLPKAYDARTVEDAIYAEWEASGVFNPDNLPPRNQSGEPYCIMMPPPNVTGVLHLGHALENSLMDTMVRFQRMRGKKVLIVPGTDHAALPTQAKVEKLLMQEGIENPRKELGRETLVAKIREFAEQSQSTILNQVKKMGTSCDWSRLVFTLDAPRNAAVVEMFRRMYEDGLIYRGSRVVNWSVKGQSTCSDDEVAHVERTATLYTFKYSKDFPMTISSTRPETKLGDTAVAVHPTDERYQAYVGKTYRVDVGAKEPLEIKVITDENVDPSFGTGALGVTPAHSPIDFEMYEKQKAKGDPISLVSVIGTDGKMTEAAGSYQGLTVEDAREKFVAWLKAEGLLEKEEEIVQNVGTSDRFGDIIEAIPMMQWWLDVNKTIPSRGKNLKDLMREAVTSGLGGDASQKVTITPERFLNPYLHRVDHLRDWCLSRQIWWGHRIPVWYKGEEIQVSATAPGEGWEQDPDTLDTWFSSGMWTFSTLGWPESTPDLTMYHPTQWIQLGYEILYLWMMRMVLMSSYALEEIPFYDVYIHGMLRDEHGKKFSKSSGANLDPLEVITSHGCDALRWSILIGTTPGNDSRFYEEKVDGARNLVNKLWNISRFILLSTEQKSEQVLQKTLADQWITGRLNSVITSVTKKLERYEFSSAGEELRDFTWNDFADWYLEIAKVEGGKDTILRYILECLLSLWHPFMPFVTEHIWKHVHPDTPLIISAWPQADALRETDAQDSLKFEILRALVTDARRLRAENGVEPAKQIELTLVASDMIKKLVEENQAVLQQLIRASSISTADDAPDGWATTVSGTTTVALNLAGTIDLEKERAKAAKELEETRVYADTLRQKLANNEFTAKAPEQVVAGMKEKLKEAEGKVKALEGKV